MLVVFSVGGSLVFNCLNSCNNCPIVTGWSGAITVLDSYSISGFFEVSLVCDEAAKTIQNRCRSDTMIHG